MAKGTYAGDTVWIIGASSGIGNALARTLANAQATLALSARNAEKLEALSSELPGTQFVYPMDVSDTASVSAAAQAIHSKFGDIHRIIFLAAAYEPMTLNDLDLDSVQAMLNTNLLGAFNLIEAVLPILSKQRRGQLAMCASAAGYIGLPGGQPYSASKAALINLAESLRTETPSHIDIKMINPGFVRTPLTEKNDFAMPMIITPGQAAHAIAKGLHGEAFEIHFPKQFTLPMKLLATLPYALSLPLLKRIFGGARKYCE